MTLPKAPLGRTDLMVSRLCLGTNQFGSTLDQAAVDDMLDAFVGLGGNFIDTARVYGDYSPDVPTGPSERAIGAWLASRGRDRLVIGTKGGAPDFRNHSLTPRVSPEELRRDLAESLDHLRTDHVDLYWLHFDDESIPVAAILETMIAEREAGRIRHLGASNWSPARIREAQVHAGAIGKEGFVAIEPSWSLAVPNRAGAAKQGYASWFEDGYAPVQAEERLAVVPFGAQGRGYLSKLAQGDAARISDPIRAQYDNAENAALLPRVEALAAAHGATVNQIGLAWVLCQPLPVFPIIGPRTIAQLQEAAGAADIRLTPEEIASLRPIG